MPIKDFCCNNCNATVLDRRVGFSEIPNCEKCGKPLSVVVSKPNFALKGDGWAKDGYK